jgi:hypothetical protein
MTRKPFANVNCLIGRTGGRTWEKLALQNARSATNEAKIRFISKNIAKILASL